MDSSDDSLVEKLTLVPVMTALSGLEDSLGLWIGTWICFTTQMSPLSSHVTTALGISKAQVWSLTQFYSVDFLQSRIGVKKYVF